MLPNDLCVDAPSKTEWANILGAGPELPMVGDPISVNPPRFTDYSSDEYSADDGDGISRPLTREELNLKTKTRINQPHRLKVGERGSSDVISARKGRRRSSTVSALGNKVLSARRASLS